MQIIFMLSGIVGLIMVFYGAKWSFKSFKANDIIEFPLADVTKQFKIHKAGLYSICITGGSHFTNSGGFTVKLHDLENQEKINHKESFAKPRYRKNGKTGIEYLQFRVDKPGTYKIELENPEDLRVERSMLKAFQLFQPTVPIQNLTVLIRESTPIAKKIMSLTFLVLGANMLVWGIILGINPNLFE